MREEGGEGRQGSSPLPARCPACTKRRSFIASLKDKSTQNTKNNVNSQKALAASSKGFLLAKMKKKLDLKLRKEGLTILPKAIYFVTLWWFTAGLIAARSQHLILSAFYDKSVY
jgi:hypothetical protein